MNIAANLRAVTTIKSEILSEIAQLYKLLADYSETDDYGNIAETIATIVAMDYILAKRLGISFSNVDKQVDHLLSIAIENNHELEVKFSDMSELKKYIKNR